MPIICIFGQLNPIETTLSEIIYIFLPYYALVLTVFSWLNKKSRSILLSDVYSLIQTIPISITVIKVLLRPFGQGFNVTPKGLSRDKFSYNWTLGLPMTVLCIASLITFSISLLSISEAGFNLGLYWSSYNLLTITIAMMSLLDLPKPSFYEWYDRKKEINLYCDRQVYQGITQKISEEGVEILLSQQFDLSSEVMIELIPEVLILSGKVTRSYVQNGNLRAIIKFQDVSIEQHRELVEMLYCIPGQWQINKTPNELQSVFILLKLLLRPLIFLNRNKIKQFKLQY